MQFYNLLIQGKDCYCIVAMSTKGIEDVDICEGNINGTVFYCLKFDPILAII